MTIALIDDHELIAKAITYMLQKDPGITEVKTFTAVPLFLESLDGSWKPDIIITDLVLPVMGGMELIEKIRKMPEFNSTRIIVLSSITDAHTIRHTFKIGANGYLSKDSSLEELTDAIQAVTEGKQYIAKKWGSSLTDLVLSDKPIRIHLTPREKDVLELVCSGFTSKEIAAQLGLSVYTVQGYHKNIMKRFRVNRTADLIVFAIQKGLYVSP
jgi:DNA-binding NarL/FixJ family response regulator